MDRKFNGIWIPKSLWFNKELSLNEKIFLCEIDSLSKNGVCNQTNTYFSDFFSLSKSRTSEIINSLKSKKFISTKMKMNSSKKYIDSRHIRILTKGYDLLGTKLYLDNDTEESNYRERTDYTKFINLFNSITIKKFRGDKKSKRQFMARITDGYIMEDFEKAITNCFDDDFHKKNPQYLTPEFITREDKLQKYLNVKVVKQTTIVGENKRVKLFSK
jgi:uncharacterized phage protein (TIGR02220 family)